MLSDKAHEACILLREQPPESLVSRLHSAACMSITRYPSRWPNRPKIAMLPRQCSSWVGKRAGCKRNWAQSSARTTKIRAQFSAQTTQNLLRVNDQNLVLWPIDENMGTNLQAFYKHFYIGCPKTQKQQLQFCKNNIYIFFKLLFVF